MNVLFALFLLVLALIAIGAVWTSSSSTAPRRPTHRARRLGPESEAPAFEPRPHSPHAYRLEYRNERADVFGRGFVVVRNEDGRALGWRTLPKREGLRSHNVVGERYRPDQLQSPKFAPGSALKLVREPDNPHDSNAVAVWDAEETLHVGYLPRDEVGPVAKMLDRGEELRCYSLWEQTDDEGRRTQVRILILTDDASVEVDTLRS